jgi:hypothetical protein
MEIKKALKIDIKPQFTIFINALFSIAFKLMYVGKTISFAHTSVARQEKCRTFYFFFSNIA